MNFLRSSLIALLVAAGPVAVPAAGLSMSSLQNLPAVGVKVRGLSPDGMTLGLSEAELVRIVTAELQKVGLRVVQGPELSQQPGEPTIEITANVTPAGLRGHLFVLRLELREGVKFVRKTANLVTVPAVTWDAEADGYATKVDVIRAKLTELAVKLAAEWTDAGVETGR